MRKVVLVWLVLIGCGLLFSSEAFAIPEEHDLTVMVEFGDEESVTGVADLAVSLLSLDGIDVDSTDIDGAAEFGDVNEGPFMASAAMFISGDEIVNITALTRGVSAWGLAILCQPDFQSRERARYMGAQWSFMGFDGQSSFEVETGLAFVFVLGWMR